MRCFIFFFFFFLQSLTRVCKRENCFSWGFYSWLLTDLSNWTGEEMIVRTQASTLHGHVWNHPGSVWVFTPIRLCWWIEFLKIEVNCHSSSEGKWVCFLSLIETSRKKKINEKNSLDFFFFSFISADKICSKKSTAGSKRTAGYIWIEEVRMGGEKSGLVWIHEGLLLKRCDPKENRALKWRRPREQQQQQ